MNVGTRVRCIRHSPAYPYATLGMRGVVRVIHAYHGLGVEWDCPFNKGHDLRGFAQRHGSGYWVPAELTVAEETTPFLDSVLSYINRELRC